MNVNFSDSSGSDVSETEESVDKKTDKIDLDMPTTSANNANAETPQDMPLDLANFHKILSKMLKSTDGTKILHADFRKVLLKTRSSGVAKARIAKYGVQATAEELRKMMRDCDTLTKIANKNSEIKSYIYCLFESQQKSITTETSCRYKPSYGPSSYSHSKMPQIP